MTPRPRSIRAHSGFTLIELSIVLVIIGLIVGGILVGRDLINTATLRRAISEEEHFETAVNTFDAKYGCIPGDCSDATQYFGGTSNGDGDGNISENGITNLNAFFTERYLFWQQLGLAGLIPGNYSGQPDPGGAQDAILPGTNVPASALSGGYYDVFWLTTAFSPNDFYPGDYGNTILLGKANVGSIFTSIPLLTNQQASYIDSKADDGLPGSGKLRSMRPYFYTPNCGTSTDPSVSVYDTKKSMAACVLLFTHAF